MATTKLARMVLDGARNILGFKDGKGGLMNFVQSQVNPVTGGIRDLTAGQGDFYLTKWVDSAKKCRAYAIKSIRPVMASPPVVTTPANLNGIANAVILSPNTNAAFAFDGVFADASFGYWGSNCHPGLLAMTNTKSSRLEFMTDSPLWGINIGSNSNEAQISIWINDELTAATPTFFANDPNPHYVLVDSTGLSAPRGPWKVRIDTNNQSFFEVRIGPGDSVWGVAYPESLRVGFVGDSITQGYKAGTGANYIFHRGWWNTCADLLGWKRAISLGIDSTGYINPGSTLKFEDRLPAIANLNLDVLVTAGGINDQIQTPAALKSAVLAYLAKVTALMPCTKHIVLGSFTAPGQAMPDANFQAIKDACSQYGATYIDTKLPTPWQTSNNASLYLNADTVHPATVGHDYIAVRVRDAINAYIDSL